jgi:hypothetical protein
MKKLALFCLIILLAATVIACPNGSPVDEAVDEDAQDTTPPWIDNVTATEVIKDLETGYTVWTITWQTDEPSSTRFAWGLEPCEWTVTTDSSGFEISSMNLDDYDSLTPGDSTLVTSHEVRLEGLASSTTYYYTAISIDEAGNKALFGEYSFHTRTHFHSYLREWVRIPPDYGNYYQETIALRIYFTTTDTVVLKLTNDVGVSSPEITVPRTVDQKFVDLPMYCPFALGTYALSVMDRGNYASGDDKQDLIETVGFAYAGAYGSIWNLAFDWSEPYPVHMVDDNIPYVPWDSCTHRRPEDPIGISHWTDWGICYTLEGYSFEIRNNGDLPLVLSVSMPYWALDPLPGWDTSGSWVLRDRMVTSGVVLPGETTIFSDPGGSWYQEDRRPNSATLYECVGVNDFGVEEWEAVWTQDAENY